MNYRLRIVLLADTRDISTYEKISDPEVIFFDSKCQIPMFGMTNDKYQSARPRGVACQIFQMYQNSTSWKQLI